MAQKISDCCGAAATDPIMLDYMICSDCKDHCEYINEEEDEDHIGNANKMVTMAQQTAVEYLIGYMSKNQYFIGNDLLEAFEQAKQMEKEQIKMAFDDGYKSGDYELINDDIE